MQSVFAGSVYVVRDNIDTVMSLDGFVVASSSRDDADMFQASATRT